MNNIPGMVNIFWFRRDLRFEDNTGLYHALKEGLPVLPLFIFDENILSRLEVKSDARVSFIYSEIANLKTSLEIAGSSLLVKYGKPDEIFREIADQYSPSKVFTNHDYEPYATERDLKVGQILKERQIIFTTYKDQVIFEKNEVVKDSGEPYTVFTPYSKKWKTKFSETAIRNYASENLLDNFIKISPFPMPELTSIGFSANLADIPSREPDISIIKDYSRTRDFPAIRGTSRLGIHLRFGTLSVRQLVKIAASTNEVYLNELIWREFYMMILWHFPYVADRSFKPRYDMIAWRNDEDKFSAWCEGMTGYPIVDAGMREMNQSGYMHNRVRMITASFLTKHLLTDWRWGEAYFAKKLLDYELASNNGGWQWAAGTGCDAAPYFRVFNPELQTDKFDPRKGYIRKWVPELDTERYPRPIVNHAEGRTSAIEAYKKALGKNI